MFTHFAYDPKVSVWQIETVEFKFNEVHYYHIFKENPWSAIDFGFHWRGVCKRSLLMKIPKILGLLWWKGRRQVVCSSAIENLVIQRFCRNKEHSVFHFVSKYVCFYCLIALDMVFIRVQHICMCVSFILNFLNHFYIMMHKLLGIKIRFFVIKKGFRSF